MAEARARELARINGRGSKPTEADYQQAKRELTGESEIDPQEENLESLPESEGWDVVPGSTGRQAAESLGEDEDAEDGARARRCSQKASAKQSTIKRFAPQRRMSRTTKNNYHEVCAYLARSQKSRSAGMIRFLIRMHLLFAIAVASARVSCSEGL